MAEESEKRFHAVMDKLFSTPPNHKSKSGTTETDSTSSSGVELSRGKKRPGMYSTFALPEKKSRGNVVDLQNLSGSGGSVQAPICRPWDREDFLRRLATFKSMTWFAKPKVVNAVNCARRGWVNIDMDIIACETCGARLLFSTPSCWTQHQVEKAALVFSLKLDNGHKLLCPWVDNACEERLVQFPPTAPAVLVDKYKKRCSALSQLTALPIVSSSAIDYMKSPEIDHFLRGSSSVKYFDDSADTSRKEYLGDEYETAQKLISLCGWELRALPYIIECTEQQDQCVKDADHLDLSLSVSSRQIQSIHVYSSGSNEITDVNDKSMASAGIQSDPNSIVLDCALCGASVGLWAFSMVPRPVEFVRLVGHTEINGERFDPCHTDGSLRSPNACNTNHLESGGSIVNTATVASTSSHEGEARLKLTIGGGPPPAKQNFKAAISLPVIGRNLRALFSSDSVFNEHGSVNNIISLGKDQQSLIEANICEKEVSETSKADTVVETPAEHAQIVVEDFNQNVELPKNAETFRTVNAVVEEHTGPRVEDSSRTLPDSNVNTAIVESSDINTSGTADLALGEHTDSLVEESSRTLPNSHVNTANGETSNNGTAMMAQVDNCYPPQTSGEVTICATESNIQDGCKVREQLLNYKILSASRGKDLKPSDKVMAFDPIRQHRHFCPWIESSGDLSAGWQQTLSALQRLEFPNPSSEDAPSKSSLIEVDDPIASVRRLFMSPSAKRNKLAHI